MPNTPPALDALRLRLQRLDGFIEGDPDNVNLLADAADCALRLGDLPSARTRLQRALELAPGQGPLLLQLSSVAIAEYNFDDSVAITSALIGDGIDDAAVLFNHAFALVHLQRYDEALPVLQRLAQQAEVSPWVPRLTIRSLHALGDLDEAIALAAAHLASHPDDADVAGMLALLCFDNEDMAAARRHAAHALASQPNNLDALIAAGMVALADEEVERGQDLLQRAVTVQPRSGRAWVGLALAELMGFDLPAAERLMQQALRHMSSHIGSWHLLGWVQLLQQKVDEAEASFRSAYELDDTFGESHGALAAIAATRGQWAEAERLAEVARRLDGESMAIRYVELLRAAQSGRLSPDEVRALLTQAIRSMSAPAGGSLEAFAERLKERKRTPST